MDGVFDLGGKQGFGPVDRTHEDEPYHSQADARAYALSVAARGERAYPIDWFRHTRENMVPTDYLTRPYFDQWLQTVVAMAIDAGDVSLDEVISGKAKALSRSANPMSVADVRNMLTSPASFEREANGTPAFEVGDSVRTDERGRSGHTRLPAYARGANGTIHAYRGAHLLPDAGAKGEDVPEHLYTVGFAARDLFPEVDNDDTIYLDLWESYFVSA